jgi:hypothetical protein
VVTRPEPTINGNCDSWDFIVGKLPRSHSPETGQAGRCGDATPSLSTTYSQFRGYLTEQLVGHLWITGGLLLNIPYRESRPALYAMNDGSRQLILTKFVMNTSKSKRPQTF